MTPTILAKDGQLFMVTGSPGGRTIINTVLETIVDVVDFGMNAQEAVDAPRFHHQWLPDRINYEKYRLLARHDRGARAPRPHAARRRRPGRRAGDRLQREGGHARRRHAIAARRTAARSACPAGHAKTPPRRPAQCGAPFRPRVRVTRGGMRADPRRRRVLLEQVDELVDVVGAREILRHHRAPVAVHARAAVSGGRRSCRRRSAAAPPSAPGSRRRAPPSPAR